MGGLSNGMTRRSFTANVIALPLSRLGTPALASNLLPIPVFDARTVGLVGWAKARMPQMLALLRSCLGSLDGMQRFEIAAADVLARQWLQATGSPYAAELEAIAPLVPEAGVYLLNTAYEWGCTTLAAPTPDLRSARLLRTLDWSFPGLGHAVEVVRQHGEAGEFVNVTWPGAVGMLTGLAPGRFAATINQAPPRDRPGDGSIGGGLGDLARIFATRSLPAMHMLRAVFERAHDFDRARAMIEAAPIAAPTIFTLVGVTPEQTCVIERTERDHVTHLGVSSAANSWRYADFRDGWDGRDADPHSDSAERRRSIERLGRLADAPFVWVVPPVRNGLTRLAVELDPGRGTLAVRGYEQSGDSDDAMRVTTDLHLIV